MRPEELRALLERSLVGVVSTLRPDGSPHAVPVWYRYDGETIAIWSDEDRAWCRNVIRDGGVAFVAHEHARPYPAVVLRGGAEVERGEEILPEIRRIVERYLPENEVDAYVAKWSGPHVQAAPAEAPARSLHPRAPSAPARDRRLLRRARSCDRSRARSSSPPTDRPSSL